jgi:ABC-type transporter Mla MlaB component
MLAAPDNSSPEPHGLRPGEPGVIELALRGRVGPSEGAELCDRVRVLLLEKPGCRVACDVASLVDADLGTLDALARLQLTAARLGASVRLRDPPSALREMLALSGLGDVVRCAGELSVQPGGQPEHREEAGGVQEERDAADPPV